MYTNNDLIEACVAGVLPYGQFCPQIITDDKVGEFHLVSKRYSDSREHHASNWKDLFSVISATEPEWIEINEILSTGLISSANEKRLRELILSNFTPFLIDVDTNEISYLRHKSVLYFDIFGMNTFDDMNILLANKKCSILVDFLYKPDHYTAIQMSHSSWVIENDFVNSIMKVIKETV
jgi:hypothetical protein